jgi:hypothetical protein
MKVAQIESDGPPPIGTHLLMGDNAKDKLQNYLRNLSEDRVSVAMGMALNPISLAYCAYG